VESLQGLEAALASGPPLASGQALASAALGPLGELALALEVVAELGGGAVPELEWAVEVVAELQLLGLKLEFEALSTILVLEPLTPRQK